jgi:hypothetical protein
MVRTAGKSVPPNVSWCRRSEAAQVPNSLCGLSIFRCRSLTAGACKSHLTRDRALLCPVCERHAPECWAILRKLAPDVSVSCVARPHRSPIPYAAFLFRYVCLASDRGGWQRDGAHSRHTAPPDVVQSVLA